MASDLETSFDATVTVDAGLKPVAHGQLIALELHLAVPSEGNGYSSRLYLLNLLFQNSCRQPRKRNYRVQNTVRKSLIPPPFVTAFVAVLGRTWHQTHWKIDDCIQLCPVCWPRAGEWPSRFLEKLQVPITSTPSRPTVSIPLVGAPRRIETRNFSRRQPLTIPCVHAGLNECLGPSRELGLHQDGIEP